MSLDSIVKGAVVAGLGLFLSLVPLKKSYSQGEPEWKTVTTQTQLFKSDFSDFSEFEAGINIDGNDISDSTNSYGIATGWAPPSGYVELTFDIFTRMPAPSGVVDVKQGFLLEDYSISNPYPQPAVDHSTFDVAVPERSGAILSLYDILGRKIYSESMDLERAINVVELSGLEDLPPSTYVVSVRGADNSYLLTQKILKMDENSSYKGFLFKSSSIPVSGDFDFDLVATNPYVDPTPDVDQVFKSGSVSGGTISDKIYVQWVIPGFGSDARLRDLWEWNDITGMYEFQNVIIDTFNLPYPSSAPGMKVDPENKSTLTVDKNYFNTNPEVNFEYKSDSKKD